MSCDPSKKCRFCDASGLAIMPVRYAVARKDTLEAPAIQAPFGEGLEHAPLPSDHASYTLRQLRGGYLYVFDEESDEWRAYVVSKTGYLHTFDLEFKTPPDFHDAEPCARMVASAAGRSVMIDDPNHSGRIWMAFSDVAWTAKVLDLHREASHREQHMRCIDLGEWAKSNGTQTQPHLDAMTKARERVAEFHVPPKPTVPTFGVRVIGYPAYDFSPQPFNNCHNELDPMLERSSNLWSQGVPPAMVALMDPVGISLDINALIATEVQTFEKAEGREWRKTTSAAIVGLRETLSEEALATALTNWQSERYATIDGVTLYPEDDEAMRQRNELMFSTLPEAQEQKIRSKAWKRYIDNYDEAERLAFEEKLQADLEQFMQTTVTPLVKTFADWYWSDTFRKTLNANSDVTELHSGEGYTSIVTACLTGLTGHQLIIDKLQNDLGGEYSDLNNVTMRGLILNNSAAAAVLDNAAAPDLETSNPFAWIHVFGAFKEALSARNQTQLDSGMARSAGLAHQLTGAIVTALTKQYNGRYRMLGLLGVLTGKQVVGLPTQASQAQMAHIISEKIALSQPNVDRFNLRLNVDRELKRLSDQPEVRQDTGKRNANRKKVFTWNLLYDADVAKSLSLDHQGKLQAGAGADVLLKPEQLRRVLSEPYSNMSKMMKLDVRLGVVGAILDGWNASMALELLDKEGASVKTGINLGAAAVGLAGAGFDLAGTVLKKYPAIDMRLARPVGEWLRGGGTLSAMLGGIGKAMGALGGILTGIFDLISAFEAKAEGDRSISYLRFATGVVGIVAAVAMLFLELPVVLVVLTFLVLAGLSLLGEWVINLLRDNKIEVWLDKTPFGAKEHGRFYSLSDQETAWRKLLGIREAFRR